MRPKWKGKELKPSMSAYRELFKHNRDLFDVVDILENGYDCARSKRKKGTFERCKKVGKKTWKVVVVESIRQWDDKPVWLIIHVGVMS